MFWHIDADIISLAIIIIVYVYNRKLPAALTGDAENVVRNRRFTRCLETAAGITVVDIAASVVMEVQVPRTLYHLLMTAYFVFIELVIVEWFLYVLTILYHGNEKGRKAIAHIVLVSYTIYAAFSCLNPWTEQIYSLGPNNEYNRGPCFSVMLILYAFYTVALFILILFRWKRIPKEFPGTVLLLTPIIIAAAIVIQLSVPGWLFIVPSYMICLVLAFLFLQTMQVKNDRIMLQRLEKVAETDNLTGLYNRSGMESMVRQTLEYSYGESVVVLIVDIDDLKRINDDMGHAEGDRCIRLVGERLKNHFRSGDTVVRYGGDEFLVFFTGSLNETTLHDSLKRLVSKISDLRVGVYNDIPVHCSVGASCGSVGKDSFDLLSKQADTALYYVKKNGKNGYAIYNDGLTAGISEVQQ